MQIVIKYKGESFTFHANKAGIYDTRGAYASSRNVAFLNSINSGGALVNVERLKGRLSG